jgi:glutaredoxin
MKMSKCCCSSGSCCQPQSKRAVHIDFLYLDTTACGRCQDTEKALDEAVVGVAAVLGAAGYEVRVNKVNIATRELAVRHRFISSPTIRVNGRDIAVELRESVCGDCGELCGDSVDCRVWVYHGAEHTSPPKELIVDAILREVYGAGQDDPQPEAYRLPGNLETYFTAKARKEKAERGEKKEVPTLKKMKIFEPALCCPTGLCGVGADPELLRISTVLEALKKHGANVDRFNLASAPAEFITDPIMNAYLHEKGMEGLPAVMVDGEIVMGGRYPGNEEFTELLGLPANVLGTRNPSASGGCGCEGGCG